MELPAPTARHQGARRLRRQRPSEIEAQIFSENYLLERPLLAAIRRETAPVLLVDEVDRADEEFEAFLLELLSDFQVTIPEFGTIARGDDSARRADLQRHARAFRRAAPALPLPLSRLSRRRSRGCDHSCPPAGNRRGRSALQVARMVGMLRKEDLRKVPGVAETLDWAATLAGLGVEDMRHEPEAVHDTLIALLKTHEDRVRVSVQTTQRLLGKVA